MKKLPTVSINIKSLQAFIKTNKRSFLLTLIILIGGATSATAQTYFVSAKQQWVETPINLDKGEQFEAAARGTWTNGGATPQWVGPQGWPSVHIGSALAPGLPLSSLIAKVDNEIFLIGDKFSGKSPAAGRLFLAMNDDDFADNDGIMQVILTIHKIVVIPPGGFPKEDIAFIAPGKFLPLMQSFLSDGKMQLSQTSEGVSLSIRSPGGGVVNSMSYFSFGTTLNGFGANDINILLPNNEWSPEQIKNAGGGLIFAQFLATSGAVFCDRFRFLLNNIHGFFGPDLSISLGNNEILLNLSLHSPSSTFRGEGNGFTSLPFGVPIPLGWEDGLCPDVAIKDLGLTIHLVPTVGADGTFHFNDPSVEVRGTPALTSIQGLTFADQVKDKPMQRVKQILENAFRQPQTKKGLESGFFSVFSLISGRQNKNLSSITIDKTGILLNFKL